MWQLLCVVVLVGVVVVVALKVVVVVLSRRNLSNAIRVCASECGWSGGGEDDG